MAVPSQFSRNRPPAKKGGPPSRFKKKGPPTRGKKPSPFAKKGKRY